LDIVFWRGENDLFLFLNYKHYFLKNINNNN